MADDVNKTAVIGEEKDEDQLEKEHFIRILNAFRFYRIYSSRRVYLAEKSFKGLLERHQNYIPRFLDNLKTIQTCISHNYEIIKLIIKDAEHMFENKTHELLDEPEAHVKQMPPTNFDMDKVKTTLKQFVRDWSVDGEHERRACYDPVIKEVKERFHNRDPSSVSVLVLGAGLGRLAFEFAKCGFCCQGNEWSLFMLLSSNFVLNKLIRKMKLPSRTRDCSNLNSQNEIYIKDEPGDSEYLNNVTTAPLQRQPITDIVRNDQSVPTSHKIVNTTAVSTSHKISNTITHVTVSSTDKSQNLSNSLQTGIILVPVSQAMLNSILPALPEDYILKGAQNTTFILVRQPDSSSQPSTLNNNLVTGVPFQLSITGNHSGVIPSASPFHPRTSNKVQSVAHFPVQILPKVSGLVGGNTNVIYTLTLPSQNSASRVIPLESGCEKASSAKKMKLSSSSSHLNDLQSVHIDQPHENLSRVTMQKAANQSSSTDEGPIKQSQIKGQREDFVNKVPSKKSSDKESLYQEEVELFISYLKRINDNKALLDISPSQLSETISKYLKLNLLKHNIPTQNIFTNKLEIICKFLRSEHYPGGLDKLDWLKISRGLIEVASGSAEENLEKQRAARGMNFSTDDAVEDTDTDVFPVARSINSRMSTEARSDTSLTQDTQINFEDQKDEHGVNVSHFKKLSDEHDEDVIVLQKYKQTREATKKNTKWGITSFEAWCIDSGKPMVNFETVKSRHLANLLREFYASAAPKEMEGRKKSLTDSQAQEYHVNSRKNIHAALNRKLKDVDRDIDIKKGNGILNAKLTYMKKTGSLRPTHRNQIIVKNDLDKIGTYLSTIDDPTILMYNVWFSTSIFFISRGLKFHSQLTLNSFEFNVDNSGRKFVRLTHDTQQKNIQGRLSGPEWTSEERMYATDKNGCPVYALEKFLFHCDPKAPALFCRPMKNPSGIIWFSCNPISKRMLSQFMQAISKNSNCSFVYTSYCLQTTAIQILRDAGV